MVKDSVSMRVPPALKIFAAPEPLKDSKFELNVTPEVAMIIAESSPVVGLKTKFFALNSCEYVPVVGRHQFPNAVRST